jgi:hypothetical protein
VIFQELRSDVFIDIREEKLVSIVFIFLLFAAAAIYLLTFLLIGA